MFSKRNFGENSSVRLVTVDQLPGATFCVRLVLSAKVPGEKFPLKSSPLKFIRVTQRYEMTVVPVETDIPFGICRFIFHRKPFLRS